MEIIIDQKNQWLQISASKLLGDQWQTDFLDKTWKKVLKQKKWTSSPNFTYSKKSRQQISSQTSNFNFSDQINPKTQKSYFRSEKRKSPLNFSFNEQFHFLETISPKMETWKHPPLNSTCSNQPKFQISASTDNFDFSIKICQERVFPV